MEGKEGIIRKEFLRKKLFSKKEYGFQTVQKDR
jgi:hypothetical protein